MLTCICSHEEEEVQEGGGQRRKEKEGQEEEEEVLWQPAAVLLLSPKTWLHLRGLESLWERKEGPWEEEGGLKSCCRRASLDLCGEGECLEETSSFSRRRRKVEEGK